MRKKINRKTQELTERNKELDCLYSISRIDSIKNISLKDFLDEVVRIFPAAWQYPEITCARITYNNQVFITDNYQDTSWNQMSDIHVHNKKVGFLEIGYLEEKPESDEGPFLKEERKLINYAAESLGKIISRRLSELEKIRLLKLERKLARQVISAQEEERKRVSQELHDEAGQALIAIKISLESIQSELPIELETLRKQMDEAIKLSKETMEQIRLLSHDLRPLALDVVGLNSTLEGYCRDFTRRTRIPVHYQGVDLINLPESYAITLYRFLQEALTNVAKHTHANLIQVLLFSKGEEIILSIEDDGEGFDLKKQMASTNDRGGIGLLGLQERLEILEGRVEIYSKPKHGTRLVAILPDRRIA